MGVSFQSPHSGTEKNLKCKPNNLPFQYRKSWTKQTFTGNFPVPNCALRFIGKVKSHLGRLKCFSEILEYSVADHLVAGKLITSKRIYPVYSYCKGENQITLSLKEICVCYTLEYLSWDIELGVIRVEFCIIIDNLTLKELGVSIT